MCKVELTENQLKVLIELINNSNFIGSSVEFISELKASLVQNLNIADKVQK